MNESEREAFIKALEKMNEEEDQEEAHIHADSLLCDVLYLLGYADIVAAYDKIPKWYA